MLLFGPLLLCAQMNYSNNGTTSGISVVNNMPNCVSGRYNCWHSPPSQTAYAFLTLSVGTDGYVCGAQSGGGIVCRTEYPANAWSQPPQLPGTVALAVAGQDNIWALAGSCADPGAGSSVWRFTGGSWAQDTGCGVSIAVDDLDQIVYVVDGYNVIRAKNYASSVWTVLPGTGRKIAAAPGLIALVGTDAHAYVSPSQSPRAPRTGPRPPVGERRRQGSGLLDSPLIPTGISTESGRTRTSTIAEKPFQQPSGPSSPFLPTELHWTSPQREQ